MRRCNWYLLGGLVIFLLAFVSGYFCLVPNRDLIRYANIDKIEVGMSRTTVEELMGCAPGDYRTGEVEFEGEGPFRCSFMSGTIFVYGDSQIDEWKGDCGSNRITFDSDNKVLLTEYQKAHRLPPSWILRIQRTCGFDP